MFSLFRKRPRFSQHQADVFRLVLLTTFRRRELQELGRRAMSPEQRLELFEEVEAEVSALPFEKQQAALGRDVSQQVGILLRSVREAERDVGGKFALNQGMGEASDVTAPYAAPGSPASEALADRVGFALSVGQSRIRGAGRGLFVHWGKGGHSGDEQGEEVANEVVGVEEGRRRGGGGGGEDGSAVKGGAIHEERVLPAGTVVALFPGLSFEPEQLTWPALGPGIGDRCKGGTIADYLFKGLARDYVVSRAGDGALVDGLPLLEAEMEGRSRAKHNPLALAHVANHPAPDPRTGNKLAAPPNTHLCPVEYRFTSPTGVEAWGGDGDSDEDEDEGDNEDGVLAFIPNRRFAPPSILGLTSDSDSAAAEDAAGMLTLEAARRAVLRFFGLEDGRGGNGGGKDHEKQKGTESEKDAFVIRSLALVAARPLQNGEEIVYNYRFNPKLPAPPWYRPVGGAEAESDQRWG